VAEVEEIEDAVGVDAHGAVAVAAAAAPSLLGGGGGIGGGVRGLGALPLPGIGDSRHLAVSLSAATEEEVSSPARFPFLGRGGEAARGRVNKKGRAGSVEGAACAVRCRGWVCLSSLQARLRIWPYPWWCLVSESTRTMSGLGRVRSISIRVRL
jgi:hypothetical protein